MSGNSALTLSYWVIWKGTFMVQANLQYFGIHVPVFIEVYVFDTAQHQKYLADFNNLNTK